MKVVQQKLRGYSFSRGYTTELHKIRLRILWQWSM